jgi:hypothetical protein
MAILKYGSSSDRNLKTAVLAQPQPSAHLPRVFAAAAWASKTFWPAKCEQVLPTRFIVREAAFHFHKRLWKIFDHKLHTINSERLSQVNSPNKH